ncbi:putative WD repeat-containing protein 43 [Cocos nucifera]|uniref:Putative WD repeat-containing protein 43 n=1 Tax=Cocos nucifera TaxID=13894 RepID=A0A8K0I1W2_COCNU|nr:putative WD repeat-containing protein 43 [Cocos nucifera]
MDFHNNFVAMDDATIDVEVKSREHKSRKGKKTTSKVQDDFQKIQDGKDFHNNFMTMDNATIDVEAKSREPKGRKGKKATSKVQDNFQKIQDGKDFHNNSMTMDNATIDVEAKSREDKSRKGKKTTSKVQDDFQKIQDGKDALVKSSMILDSVNGIHVYGSKTLKNYEFDPDALPRALCFWLYHSDNEGKSKDHELEVTTTPIKKKKVKKRLASDLYPLSEGNCISDGGVQKFGGEVNLDEPTMEEKLASLDLLNDDISKNSSKQEPSPTLKLPSADSVHILLKQALHAEDHALLLDCLYTRDEKVIEKSISLLNPAEVLQLLASLKSMVPSRGAALVCALPWLSSLLRQHASGIASQQSSLLILNSLYQLIDSRISTFSSAVQLSTCLDYLFAGIPGDEANEEQIPPVVYEDRDSEEEKSENEMEIVEEGDELGDVIDASRDSDGSEVMSG